ncbi:MAG: cytochrome c oxidase subunit I [Actinobacteria bacterium]|nr:cytochrome c oxidase subunit I [Actinomycetota bacterium]
MASSSVAPSGSVFRRPLATKGWGSWLTTVDHKKIGKMYGFTAFAFFLIGGLEAVFIRLQLAEADASVLSAEVYNQFFTMHGITMIFLVVMPMAAAFFNFLIPLQIGARDVAFPRLNAFSYWAFLFGGLFLYSSFIFGGAPNGGWFGYAPLSTSTSGLNMAYYGVGLQILGISSLAASVNFITTILNMRAPGLTMMRLPVFIWMSLVVNFLLLFAMPVIAVALFQLTFDKVFFTSFFQAATGGDPVLWQHLFWLFGHPEVYILILPAMGMVSEILPVFSRKPLFGYAAVVFAGAAIGFMGWGVWAHHMFAVGLGPVANSAFALSTMFIAVPTGIKIFNWVFTMWGGKIRFTTPMLFAIGFVAMFTIGGLSGVMHAIVPHDAQQTDTYFVVAHFHYVLFGGALFGIMGGMYFWWPKLFGKMLDERLGKIHFWLWFVGFNLAFGPMHIAGLLGQPRRTYVYGEELGSSVERWNQVSTLGSLIIVVSVVVFIWNAWKTYRSDEIAPHDPWDARTLEWLTPTPVPEHNFDVIPTVTHRDEFWHRKYAEDDAGRAVPVPAGASEDHAAEHGEHEEHIHMPDPSYWPLVLSAGLPFIGYGVIYKSIIWAVIGLVLLLTGVYGWQLEPVAEGDE